MAFALCPDGGPPRLWRFVDDDVMTRDRVVSYFTPDKNILVINKPLYDQLAPLDQHRLLRTQARTEFV